jgi:hypothetical protein
MTCDHNHTEATDTPSRTMKVRKSMPKLGAGADLIHALEMAWGQIRKAHPELPAAMIVTGSGIKAQGLTWAHFAPKAWKVLADGTAVHELFVSSECLARGAWFTLETILHEAAHFLAEVRGVMDHKGAYHNAKFRELAGEFELVWPADRKPHKTLGYSECLLDSLASVTYADTLNHLESAIKVASGRDEILEWLATLGLDKVTMGSGGHTVQLPKGAGTTSKVKHGAKVRLVCACPEPRVIQTSRKNADKGGLGCHHCGVEFTEAI